MIYLQKPYLKRYSDRIAGLKGSLYLGRGSSRE